MERRKCRDLPHVSHGDDGVCKEHRIIVNVRATKIEQPWEQREKERGGEKRMGERRGRERGGRLVERRSFNQGEIMAGRTCDFIQSSYNQHTGSVLLHLFPNITDFILPAASCGREEGRGKGAAQCVQY